MILTIKEIRPPGPWILPRICPGALDMMSTFSPIWPGILTGFLTGWESSEKDNISQIKEL